MVINITKAPLAPPALQGNNSMRTALILGMFLTFLAAPAMAQGQNTFAVNGTVHTFGATSIAIQNDDGGAVETFPLSPQLLVVQTKPSTLSDIKPNDFIASAAVRKEDGKLHSGADFSWGRAGIATKMRYAFGFPRQGFQRRPIPDAMPTRQHTR